MLIFVIGAPGSGKGTLCGKLAADFGYAHLSVGEHLREMLCTRSEDLSPDIITAVLNHKLLQVVDLASILTDAIDNLQARGNEMIIIDGFPRDIDQVSHIESSIGSPHLVIFLDCPEAVARERYLARVGAGRDSTVAVFDKRYKEFQQLNIGIVAEYERRGILHTVNSAGTSEESYEKLLAVLQKSRLQTPQERRK